MTTNGHHAEPDWSQALCAQTDPDAFHPEKGQSARPAKGVCAACDIREGCLSYALANDERFGIWGGTSYRERRKITRKLESFEACKLAGQEG